MCEKTLLWQVPSMEYATDRLDQPEIYLCLWWRDLVQIWMKSHLVQYLEMWKPSQGPCHSLLKQLLVELWSGFVAKLHSGNGHENCYGSSQCLRMTWDVLKAKLENGTTYEQHYLETIEKGNLGKSSRKAKMDSNSNKSLCRRGGFS